MKCDVCGDEMEDKDSGLLEGIEISVVWGVDDGPLHPEYKKLIDTFGKSEFHICFTCWIISLGVKPIK